MTNLEQDVNQNSNRGMGGFWRDLIGGQGLLRLENDAAKDLFSCDCLFDGVAQVERRRLVMWQLL